MVTQAQVIRANRQAEAQRQIDAMNFDQQPDLANGIPASGSNDAALAAHIEEWKRRDVSYQRAANEEQREQIEGAYRATQQRLAEAKQGIKDRAEVETAQQNQADVSQGDRLAVQMQTLTDTFPPNWTPETLPMDKLRQLTDLRQQVNDLASVTGAQGLADGVLESGGPLAPATVLGMQTKQAWQETFPDGQAVHVTQNQDGTLHVEYATGEKFDGDPLTVTQRIGQAHVSTKLWARQKAAQAQQTPEPMQLNQPAIQSQAPTQQSTIADYWAAEQATALAKQFGFSSKDEMLQWGENVNQKMAAVTQYEDDRLALEFTNRCPDFPGTPEASDALVNIVRNNGWQYNADSLQAAHLLAVQNHVYQPISAEALRAANGNAPQSSRPTAPPMLQGGNPEITHSVPSPYDMPIQDLRKAAIRQELERSGPGYR